MTSYIINKGVLRINTSEAGDILSIGCSKGYKGLCKGIYGPGITVEHLLKVSSQQTYYMGLLSLIGILAFIFLFLIRTTSWRILFKICRCNYVWMYCMLKMLPGGLTHNLHPPTLNKFVSAGCWVKYH